MDPDYPLQPAIVNVSRRCEEVFMMNTFFSVFLFEDYWFSRLQNYAARLSKDGVLYLARWFIKPCGATKWNWMMHIACIPFCARQGKKCEWRETVVCLAPNAAGGRLEHRPERLVTFYIGLRVVRKGCIS